MKTWTVLMGLLLLAPVQSLNMDAHAQTIDPRKIPDATFVRIEMIKFSPGGEDRAFELEDQYLNAARKTSGVLPLAEYHTQSGPWDRIYVYRLDGGLADLEWQVSPERARFLTALAKIAGGRDKALAIVAEWDALVQQRESMVGHYHPPQ
jgi:hypothetical protein